MQAERVWQFVDGQDVRLAYVTAVLSEDAVEAVDLQTFRHVQISLLKEYKVLDQEQTDYWLKYFADLSKQNNEVYRSVSEQVVEQAQNFMDHLIYVAFDAPAYRGVDNIVFDDVDGVLYIFGRIVDSYDPSFSRGISAPLEVLFDVRKQLAYIAEKQAIFAASGRDAERAAREERIAELRAELAMLEAGGAG